MIKTVLFDFGGVLTQSGKTGYTGQLLADLYGVDADSLVGYGDLHYQLRRGKISDDEFFTTLNKRFGKHVTKEQYVERSNADLIKSPGVYELAENLRGQGIRTGILSNIFSINAEQFRLGGWYDGFDPVILSCEEGFAKPDAAFYRLAVDKLGSAPQEILFIDDQIKCTEPAQTMGMHVIVAVTPKQIVLDTKALIRDQNGISL